MPPDHLRILRQESSASLRGIAEQKDHMNHKSPLSVVDDPPPRPRRQNSWSKSFSKLPLVSSLKSPTTPKQKRVPLPLAFTSAGGNAHPSQLDEGTEADNDGEGDEAEQRLDGEKSLSERVLYWNPVSPRMPLSALGLTVGYRIEITRSWAWRKRMQLLAKCQGHPRWGCI